MTLLEKYVWKSHIRVDTKVRLYQPMSSRCCLDRKLACTVTKALARRLDAFDTWSVRKIIRIPYTRHVTNASVRESTGCPPVSSTIKTRTLRFFGHVASSDSRQDHHRAASASFRPPRDLEGARVPWLRRIDVDVQSANIGIHSAWRKATIVFSGDVSSTPQHCIRGTPLKKKFLLRQKAAYLILIIGTSVCLWLSCGWLRVVCAWRYGGKWAWLARRGRCTASSWVQRAVRVDWGLSYTTVQATIAEARLWLVKCIIQNKIH